MAAAGFRPHGSWTPAYAGVTVGEAGVKVGVAGVTVGEAGVAASRNSGRGIPAGCRGRGIPGRAGNAGDTILNFYRRRF